MPRLDTEIVIDTIPIKFECPLVRHALRSSLKDYENPKASFLIAIAYSNWVANIVPMPKKDGKVCMGVDYRDLNQASLKDNFPMPHIDT